MDKADNMDKYETVKHNRPLKVLSIVTAIVVIFACFLFGYWCLYPYDPIDTYPQPYKIVYPSDLNVDIGGVIVYEFDYNKKMSILPEINRQFIDGLVFNIAGATQPTVTDLGTGRARVEVAVPSTLPPGEYYLRIRAVYKVNPIREYIYETRTETFYVIDPKAKEADE